MDGKTRRTFGVSPLNRAIEPSCLIRSLTTVTPESLVSKFWFWMRVLIVSRGAATVIDATAPATDAIKFCVQVALEKSLMPRTYSFVAAEAPKSCTGSEYGVSVGRKEVEKGEVHYREAAWGISRHSPSPTAVKSAPLLFKYSEHTTTAERLWIDLHLDLEGIEGEQDDLADTSQAACGSMHHGLPASFAKGVGKRVTDSGGTADEVVEPRLTTKFVYALGDFVPCRVAQSGEEAEDAGEDWRRGLVAEDDAAQI